MKIIVQNPLANRDYIFNIARPHGGQTEIGAPTSILVAGLATGSGIVSQAQCQDEADPNILVKRHTKNIAGWATDFSSPDLNPRGHDVELQTNIKGHYSFPFNLISSSVSLNTGYNKQVTTGFDTNTILANLHSDTTYLVNDIPMQGPFTEQWVGGHQHRHIDLNKYDVTLISDDGGPTLNNLDDEFSRPEAWMLLFGDHQNEAVQDGAVGMVSPDFYDGCRYSWH